MANLTPYAAGAQNPWNKERVIHFYRRLGYGPRPEQLAPALAADPLVLVESALDGIKTRPCLHHLFGPTIRLRFMKPTPI